MPFQFYDKAQNTIMDRNKKKMLPLLKCVFSDMKMWENVIYLMVFFLTVVFQDF